MHKQRFLITGATGATGGATAALLLDKGREVRTFVHREDERSDALRRRGAEVIVGDLLDFDRVRDALRGVSGAYFVYPIRPGLVQATAQFANPHGKPRVCQVARRTYSMAVWNCAHWFCDLANCCLPLR